MEITGIETFLVPPRWLFLRVDTDEGVSGWGEPVVEGRAHTVQTAVHELADYVLGRDPLLLEEHWQALTKAGFYRGGPVLSSAVSGFDQALWDIAGKVRGAPVHELLGGPVRDRARVYSWIGGDEPEPAALAEEASAHMEAGFTAVKLLAAGRVARLDTAAATRAIVARAEAVRDAIGDGNDFALDFHGRFTVAQAVRVAALLEPAHPLFLEEPILPGLPDEALARVVASTSIPIAAGERLFGRAEFLGPLRAGVAVVQPDASHAGGISEVRRIAALAEPFDALLAPHCPLGPISLAASLQVAFATPNFLIQEQSLGIHYNVGSDVLDYLVDRETLRFVDGHVARPTRPGLGIEIDEAAVRRAAETGHRWRPPVWRHSDGSLSEW
jgi:galactonate dehydratase